MDTSFIVFLLLLFLLRKPSSHLTQADSIKPLPMGIHPMVIDMCSGCETAFPANCLSQHHPSMARECLIYRYARPDKNKSNTLQQDGDEGSCQRICWLFYTALKKKIGMVFEGILRHWLEDDILPFRIQCPPYTCGTVFLQITHSFPGAREMCSLLLSFPRAH